MNYEPPPPSHSLKTWCPQRPLQSHEHRGTNRGKMKALPAPKYTWKEQLWTRSLTHTHVCSQTPFVFFVVSSFEQLCLRTEGVTFDNHMSRHMTYSRVRSSRWYTINTIDNRSSRLTLPGLIPLDNKWQVNKHNVNYEQMLVPNRSRMSV